MTAPQEPRLAGLAERAAASAAMLGKVRKLLAQAEHPNTTPAEAEAFTARAAELIARYGIDRAMLAAADPDTDRLTERLFVLDAPYARDKGQLLGWVATALGCRAVLYGAERMRLFGYGADIDRAELLYTSLLVQAAHALAVEGVPWGEHPAAFRRSWYAGFGSAVAARLRAAEQAARERAARDHSDGAATGGPSVALVLADRAAVVDRFYAETNPGVRPGRRRALSGSGARDGYRAGLRADLDGTRLRAADRSRGAIA